MKECSQAKEQAKWGNGDKSQRRQLKATHIKKDPPYYCERLCCMLTDFLR